MSQPDLLPNKSKGPVFIGGLERSGKTYLRMMLSAHPSLVFSRRLNYWSGYYNRYGNLNRAENLDRCLMDLLRSKHIRALSPNLARLKRDLAQAPVSYGRLFAQIHEHHAERMDKPRWGSQMTFLERFTREIFESFPNARIVQMIRDPRDRYEGLLHKYQNRGGVGVATARWCLSAKLAEQNLHRYPKQYKIVHYESLVRDPESTLEEVCQFLEEPFHRQMLLMQGEARFADSVVNDEGEPMSPLSPDYIGRYQNGLSAGEISYIQKYAGSLMSQFDYRQYPVRFSWQARLRFHLLDLPIDSLYLFGWRVLAGGKP